MIVLFGKIKDEIENLVLILMDYFIVQPLCGTDPILVLEFAMLVLESCPTQTIDLFLSGNIPADLVNSYLKQHAPNMQTTYLELMLAMNENGISGNLQNEMVNIFILRLSFVLSVGECNYCGLCS